MFQSPSSALRAPSPRLRGEGFAAGALFIILLSCNSPRSDAHVTAAALLTQRCAAPPYTAWHIHATAAGSDCSVLVLQAEIILEDSMIEALHYGAGAYNTLPRGVKQFTADHAFRGVIYKDVSGRSWPYGAVTEREVEEVTPCR